MFENGVLMKNFEHKRKEVTRGKGEKAQRRLYYTFSLANTIGVTKYRSMIRAYWQGMWHV
jgi:hypothetical protein